jgi:hypothetical protein
MGLRFLHKLSIRQKVIHRQGLAGGAGLGRAENCEVCKKPAKRGNSRAGSGLFTLLAIFKNINVTFEKWLLKKSEKKPALYLCGFFFRYNFFF